MKIHVHCDDLASSPEKRQAAEAVIRSLRRQPDPLPSRESVVDSRGGGSRTRSNATSVGFSLGNGGR